MSFCPLNSWNTSLILTWLLKVAGPGVNMWIQSYSYWEQHTELLNGVGVGVKWEHWALESLYLYVETETHTERFVTLYFLFIVYYPSLCLWNSSEWASFSPFIWHSLARPPSSTAYLDYHNIFMRELVCCSLAFFFCLFFLVLPFCNIPFMA